MKLTQERLQRIIFEERKKIVEQDMPKFDDPIAAWKSLNRTMTARVKNIWERAVKKRNPEGSAKAFVTFTIDEGIKPPITVELENVLNIAAADVEELKSQLVREFEKEEFQGIWPGLTYGEATQPYSLS